MISLGEYKTKTQVKQKQPPRCRQQIDGYQKEGKCGEDEMGKRGQVYVDRWKLDFWWWVW